MPARNKLVLLGVAVLAGGFVLGVGIGIVRKSPFGQIVRPGERRDLTHDEMAGPAAITTTADKLKDTIVTAHLEQEIIEGKNILWCATAQIAWNELCSLAGEDIRLVNEPPMVGILNKKSVTKNDLDEDSYVAMAGFVQDGIIQRIEKELARKFQGRASPELLRAVNREEAVLLAYSYLFKNLPFYWAFDRMDKPLEFGKVEVASFGIFEFDGEKENEVRAARQILIYDCDEEGDFIVELKTRSENDQLLLAHISPKTNLAETVAEVRRTVDRKKPREFKEYMSLTVPIADFDVLREYTELYRRRIQSRNPRFDGLPLGLVKQQIRFRLDESGAGLTSEAMIPAPGGGRRLIFDKPFLIMIQRKRAEVPYFALWVGNAELLVPFDKDDVRYNSLIDAVVNHNVAEVKRHLAEGADIDHKDEYGSTALHHAVYVDNAEIIKLLLDNGADPNKAGESGRTPLDEALYLGDSELVKLLKAHGAKGPSAGVVNTHVEDISISKVSKIPFADPSGITLYKGYGGEICKVLLEMEFSQEPASVTMGEMKSATTDAGRSLLPEQQSPPLSRISSPPDRGHDGHTWFVTITLCAPKPEEKSLKEISGEFEYVTASEWKTSKAGIIDFASGAKAQHGKVTVHSIKAVTGGDTLVDLVLDLPASVIKSVRFYRMNGSELDAYVIWPPEQHPTDPKSITSYCFSEPLPNKGRVELDIFEDAKSHKVLFKVEDIPLEYARNRGD